MSNPSGIDYRQLQADSVGGDQNELSPTVSSLSIDNDRRFYGGTTPALTKGAWTLSLIVVGVIAATLSHYLTVHYNRASDGRHHHDQPSSPPVPPAMLPEKMIWRLTLIEHHDAVSPGANDTAFGNYYFDWSRDDNLLLSRQENSVSYAKWRFQAGDDIPWNVFWADRGTVAAAYIDLNSQTLYCQKLPFAYTSAFWPRNFLHTNCTPSESSAKNNKKGKMKKKKKTELTVTKEKGEEEEHDDDDDDDHDFLSTQLLARPLPYRFGGRFYDGQQGVSWDCVLSSAGSGMPSSNISVPMTITPTVYTDPSTGKVLRFDIVETTPGWNPQTWDILEQVELNDINSTFLHLPENC